jgi:hypothetical protein
MGYLQLSQPALGVGENIGARMDALEALQLSVKGTISPQGTHFYAGGYVPVSFTDGNDTTDITNDIWVNEVRIRGNTLITGVSYLIGSVGTTDTVIAILYDSSGNVLAYSALAGTTVGTAETFQRLPFVTAYQASPGLYYIGISTNGTHAHLQTQVAGNHNAGVITGQTFGTPTAITPPSTFTANKGPIAMLY